MGSKTKGQLVKIFFYAFLHTKINTEFIPIFMEPLKRKHYYTISLTLSTRVWNETWRKSVGWSIKTLNAFLIMAYNFFCIVDFFLYVSLFPSSRVCTCCTWPYCLCIDISFFHSFISCICYGHVRFDQLAIMTLCLEGLNE